MRDDRRRPTRRVRSIVGSCTTDGFASLLEPDDVGLDARDHIDRPLMTFNVMPRVGTPILAPSTSLAEMRSLHMRCAVDPMSKFHTALFGNRAKRPRLPPVFAGTCVAHKVSDSQVSSTMDGHIIL